MPADPLEFFDLKSYPDRMSEAQSKTGLTEAFLAVLCKVSGHPTALGILDFSFLGGSMGSVVGERFTRLAKAAIEERRAFVVIASSGGARMQEGLFSLMQMAKTIFAASMVGEARSALHNHPHASDHWRRVRELGHHGRHHLGRAGRGDELRRGSRHRADHTREATGRLRHL